MSWAQTKLILDAIVENGISSANGTIIMIPMDANKYGYNLQMYDIDGVTPLADVKINGVTDPNTEIRTNAQGNVKFISGSPSHNISFTEFPAGYQYADIFTARTIRGYINDMTRVTVAPKLDNFAGFNITLKDNNGSPLTNRQVTCSQNGKQYSTNSSGVIEQVIYSSQASLTFTWSTSGVYNATTANGSLQQYNTTANYSATVSGGVIGQTTALTSSNATVSYSGTGYRVNAAASVGAFVTIGTRQYVIADVTSSIVYVALRYWEEDVKFSPDGTASYAQSSVKNECVSWYSSKVPSVWKTSANAFTKVTTEGISAECFIPTKSQLDGGWDYFISDYRRTFRESSGDVHRYWTSSSISSGKVYYISTSGSIDETLSALESIMIGFRPALAIKRSLFS